MKSITYLCNIMYLCTVLSCPKSKQYGGKTNRAVVRRQRTSWTIILAPVVTVSVKATA